MFKKYFFTILLFCLVTPISVSAQITPPSQSSKGYGSSQNYISNSYSSHESGVLEEGTQLFYYIPDVLKNGLSAPAVIFLHGMFATAPPFTEENGYSEHLTHLLQQGYIVIYPQFNTEADVDQNLLLERSVTSADTALAAIGAQVETDNLVLYGHSVGGILCVCWQGAGGVPVKALVAAQGNMNPCAGPMPDWVCPLITKLDYQSFAPSMTCPAILLWGDADTDFATWGQQLDAFNSLTNVSSKIIYTAQSDDYGDPDLTAHHGAPNPPVDTLDYRYYWAALDAALDDKNEIHFDMGLWSDGTPVKPVLTFKIDTCKVKAGKKSNGDSMKLSGLLSATTADLTEADTVIVAIETDDIPDLNTTRYTIPITNLKNGKYKSSKAKPENKSDPVTSFKFDSVKGKFKFSGKKLDLTGLSCPITVTIQVGDYAAEIVLQEDIVNGAQKPCPPELMACIGSSDCGIYTDAGVLDNRIIEQAQIMTTHIEDSGIEVRATKVDVLEFGGSYAGINAVENWVQPYFTFLPEDMSAYTNTPSEINGIINTKMKSKDIIGELFEITLEGTQGICADVQEEIYAATFSLLSRKEKAKYRAEGKSLSFIQDNRPGDDPGDNPVTQGSNWTDVDPATMITSDGDDYFYEPMSLYVTIDNPIFQNGGGDERYRGVRYCKLLSHQAILSWLLTKSFEDDPTLIAESAEECTDPRLRMEESAGSCLFSFPLAGYYYCSDYVGYDFTPESAELKCSGRPTVPDLPPTYSPDPCSERTAEIEATIPGYVGHGALCAVHCKEGDEFIWNVYEEDPETACGNYDVFYP